MFWPSNSLTSRFWVLLSFTLASGPIFIYAIARLSGQLPSERQWEATAGNHGPWWGDGLGIYITLSVLLVMIQPFLSLIFGAVRAMERKKAVYFGHSIILAGVQVSLFYILVNYVFWTVD